MSKAENAGAQEGRALCSEFIWILGKAVATSLERPPVRPNGVSKKDQGISHSTLVDSVDSEHPGSGRDLVHCSTTAPEPTFQGEGGGHEGTEKGRRHPASTALQASDSPSPAQPRDRYCILQSRSAPAFPPLECLPET